MAEDTKQSEKVSNWCLISMASIPLIMTLGNSMLIPVLPILERRVNISPFQSSLIITSYSIASIFLIPVAGYLSDRIGRKRVIVPSLIIVMAGGLVSAWASWRMADPFWTIIVGRILQGVGAAGAAPIVMPLVGDLYKKEDEASSCLGIIETSNTAGKVLSPILGSALAAWVWFLPFFSITIFSAISVIMVLFFIKAPKTMDKPKKITEFISNTKEIFKQEGRWLYTIFFIGCFAMFILFAVQFFLSQELETKYHAKGINKGLLLAIPLAFLCISSYITGRKIKGDKKLMKKLIYIGLMILSVSIAFTSQFDNLIILLAVTSIFGASIGLLLPTLDALITENIEKEERGTITSFYSSARFIGVAVGPPVMAFLLKNNPLWGFIGSALAGLLLVFVVKKFIRVEDSASNKGGGKEQQPAP
ncbi:ACDE family multidrug resistance protein [Peribacillus deserti]|uniref:ACDE family multidrug resistance protein n=1 Tax=Peribacillus deserti TaxID=673318 RepID=A0ABS2QKB7_9BACI|nr:MFS transporter [Peribacillus deserti]MBM7693400.1 ACDE family multidrug resistance protein [Peribacillus deserti]